MVALHFVTRSMADFDCSPVMCFGRLPELSDYTKEIVNVCRQSESEVASCFQKIFENESNSEIAYGFEQKMHHLEKIKKSGIGMEHCCGDTYIIFMNTLDLQLWFYLIELSIKNEYIIRQVGFTKRIGEIMSFFNKHIYPDSTYIEKIAYMEFRIVSKTTTDEFLPNILYLFNFIMKARQHYNNYSDLPDLDVTNKEYEENINRMNDQTIKLNDKDQQSNHVHNGWTSNTGTDGNNLQKNANDLRENIRSNDDVQNELQPKSSYGYMKLLQDNGHFVRRNKQAFRDTQQVNSSQEQIPHNRNDKIIKDNNKEKKRDKRHR